MSLKEKVDTMRIVTKVKWGRHGYGSTEVISTLYAYIGELEAKLAAPAKKALAKKAPAPAKKATAKKTPAKKTTKK